MSQDWDTPGNLGLESPTKRCLIVGDTVGKSAPPCDVILSIALQLTFIIKYLLLCCKVVVDTAELESKSFALVLWVGDFDECRLV